MRHVMIDLETLDTKPSAHVLAIGAVCFDPDAVVGQACLGEEFYLRVTGEQPGRTISVGTVAWWARQPEAARLEVFDEEREGVGLTVAVARFGTWLLERTGEGLTYFWANDPDFDVAILRHAWAQAMYVDPIPYNMGRSLRTVVEDAWGYDHHDLWPTRDLEAFPKHHAWADAKYQAIVICQARQQIYRSRHYGEIAT